MIAPRVPNAYAPHAAFVALAHQRTEPWRTAIGFALIALTWFFATLIVPYYGPEGIRPLVTTLLFHLTFAVMTAATFWVTRNMQRRAPLSLFGSFERLPTDFARCALAVLALYAVLYLAPPWVWEGISLARAPVTWALLLPVSILAVLIQSSAEEIVFRGFLQQSLGARFTSPLVWMGIPSVLFGLVHYNMAEPLPASLQHMIWAGIYGLAAADLTARTGGLGAAIGLHAATNFVAIVVFSPPWPLSGLGLFNFTGSQPDAEFNIFVLLVELLVLWMTWMACRIAVRA